MSKRLMAGLGLIAVDIGVFVATCAFLPQRGSFGHSGPLSYYVNSRARWDIAWAVLLAAIFLSIGAFLLMDALGAFHTRDRSSGNEE